MISKKVCMVGAFSVGKTSLVQRFVRSIFSEKYLTTLGVKIDKKVVTVDGNEVTLMLWDIYGEDEFQKLRISYLKGASGYLLVADGTRPDTLDAAVNIHERIKDTIGHLPFILLLNKSDLTEEWELKDEDIADLLEKNWTIQKTSAKTGAGVEEAFFTLARKMIEK